MLIISSIAPGHGPIISTSLRSLLNDYQRWGDQQSNGSINIVLLFASAYGNTAAIADSLAKGISSTGIHVKSNALSSGSLVKLTSKSTSPTNGILRIQSNDATNGKLISIE